MIRKAIIRPAAIRLSAILLSAILLAGLLLPASAGFTEEAPKTNLTTPDPGSSPLTITPKEAVRDGEFTDGSWRFGVRDADHLADRYFILSLYAEELYDREAIENLMPGDKIVVGGETHTVGYILVHGWYDSDGDGEGDESRIFAMHPDQIPWDQPSPADGGAFSDAPAGFEVTAYELIMPEDFDGYIVFEPVSDTECRSLINDRTSCEYLADVTVPLPLPGDFVFLDYADNEGNAEAFLYNLSDDWYFPFNSRAWFKDGQLIKVSHSDYPSGP